MKVYLESLGCAKNMVDSEMILGLLKKNDFEIVSLPEQSDIIMVNTCAFIESAREEAINTILALANYKENKRFLVVVGCLAQRYKEELIKEMNEVDLFVSIKEYPNLINLLNGLLKSDYKNNLDLDPLSRVFSTPDYMRYVKISEGCFNRCAFCAIPLIRGNLVSRTIESIVSEVKQAALSGVKEINLISQDTTKYGFDLYKKLALVDLLKELVKIEGNFKIRLLYLYPDIVTDELICFIRDNDKIMPYFDIPIQHSEDHVLEKMRRRGNREYLLDLFKKIRKEIPHAILRTTLIVGFPYETLLDVENMVKFIEEVKFDRLGAFTFSLEEDTKACEYPNVISEASKNERYNMIMDAQYYISLQLNRDKIGKTFDVLVEGYDEESYMYQGRSYGFAPDDIDGLIYVAAKDEINFGDVVKVKILDADAYTLTGEQIE